MNKNKNIAFHGGNEAALEVYKRVRDKTRTLSDELKRPYYAWETIKQALDSLDQKENTSIALEVATYERLSKLAAQLRIDNPGGGFVSMSTAVEVLLDAYEKPVSLRAYAADAEVNDPQFLQPENETE